MQALAVFIPRVSLSRQLLPGLLTAWLLLVGGAAFAETRFVAISGNNSGNTCLASGAPCKTITHALTQAVAGDTISVAAGTYNLALGETFPLTINKALTLTGAGAGSTILDATGANTRVIQVLPFGSTATIAGVTITGGHVSCAASGGGFGCVALGGGLVASATTLTNVTLSGNTTSCTASESSFCQAFGGGLRGGSMTLTNVTVRENTVSCTSSGGGICQAFGGGLDNVGFTGITTLTNVTLSGNTTSCTSSGGGINCSADGAGLYNEGAVELTNVTLSGNTTSCDGTGCAFSGALSSPGFMSLQNTIVAKQLVGPDCSNNTSPLPPSFGHNLDSDSTCQLTQPSDHPGVTDPLLGPLQNNGGPTQTHALLPGSPAIDAGTISGCPSTDQRGITRPQGGTCDIGAFEFGVNVAGVLLNGSAFDTSQTITYQATLFPGAEPPNVDIYLGVLLPDGVTFLSFVPGPGETIVFVFDTVPVPFSANVTLAPTDVPFAYTFTGTEPVGTYFTYAGLAVAGSDPLQAANQLSVGIQAFQFTQ